jgi:hypothetical protein
MASVGPQMCSPSSLPSLMPVPSHPISLVHSSSHRRYAFPHVFRFNGCWSSFRLLLFAFRRFRSFPRSPRSRPPRTGHPLILHAHPRCASLQLGLFVMPCLPGITFRRQFAISFSHRSECFFIALRCFRVSSPRFPGSLPRGGHGLCIKRRRGQSRRRYIRTNILHPHPPPPPYLQHSQPTATTHCP